MLVRRSRWLILTIVSLILIMMICGCSLVTLSMHPFSKKDETLNEKEIEFLSEYYVNDKKTLRAKLLTTEEAETLKSLRALELYIDSNYTELSYKPTEILPASVSGMEYDLYYVAINGGKEYVFHVKKVQNDEYQVTYDEFSHT